MSIIRDVTIKSADYLDGDEAILFVGARQAGKTTILKQIEEKLKSENKTTHFLNLEDPDYLRLLNESVKNLSKIIKISPERGKRSFVFLDEIQYLSNPTNFLKYYYDEFRGRIKILASGSSAFYLDRRFKDSLVGRKKIFNVKTLSFKEFLRFKGEDTLSLGKMSEMVLMDKEKISNYYGEYIVYGGYPKVVLADVDEKSEVLSDIAYSYIKKDVLESKVSREDVFFRLLKMLSAQIGNLVNASELANALNVSKTAIDNYLYIMQKSYHIYLVRPFFTNVRKELTKMPKVYFADLGLRNFLAGNFETYQTRQDKGSLLENAIYREIIDENGRDNVNFWRTADGNEVDFVVGGRKAYEVKVNPSSFKKKKIKKFLGIYSEMDFSIATYDKKESVIQGYKVLDPWEIGG